VSFIVYHRWGECESDPPCSSFAPLLDELEERPEDLEHGSVSVVHESEWALGIMRGGYVAFELATGEGPSRHLVDVPRAKVIELMTSLSRGDIASLEAEPWLPGY
jgi:thiol-disulfide isomerase/thioredoxin